MKQYKGLLFLFSAVVLIQVVLGCFIFTHFTNSTDRGTFGDMFGAVNTLFSGLAFAGVIYAIFLQSQELELQRNELELTRNELSKSAVAQTEQAKLMIHTAKINAISSKLNTFTTLFTNDNHSVEKRQKHANEIENMLSELDILLNTYK